MDVPRRVPGARRLSSPPTMHTFRPPSARTRSHHTLRRRTARPLQPLSRAALKSLAPLNLDIPSPPHEPETSLYLVILNHLTDLEARLHTSASGSALEVLHKLRDEVAAFFPACPVDPSSPNEDEYDFEYDFGLGSALALDLDLNLNLRARYDELSNLTLDEAKNKLAELSALGYDDAKSRLDALGVRLGDAKDRLVRWADGAVPSLSTLPIPDLPTLAHLPQIDLPALPLPDLHARLAELRAALPADVSSATDRLVSFVESLIEDDADGDVSWVDARWKGLNISGGFKETVGVDMHAVALRMSEGGKKLIRYCDLPEKWRNNEFVEKGYRFIPSAQWTKLVCSAFEMHNETVNIQTHLIPLLAILSVLLVPFTEFVQSWGWKFDNLVPTLPLHSFAAPTLPSFLSTSSWADLSILSFHPLPPSPADVLPKSLFLLAAAACLACSTAWHTLAGCSDLWWLEAGARVDYVGIGWLISASVSGVMYYGFACQPGWMRFYISIAIATGIAGSVLPFQGWFNERRNKKWRIAFFLLCACSAVVPLGHLAWRHSLGGMWDFIRPVVPSLASYLIGLAFYATHFPECCFPGRFDWGGSHAVWHVFIVVAIREHWKATAVFHETSHAFSCAPV